MPSHAVSIRAIETERYKVIDQQKNDVLEEIEESKAFFQVKRSKLTAPLPVETQNFRKRSAKCFW